jgi:hypothetical protein
VLKDAGIVRTVVRFVAQGRPGDAAAAIVKGGQG